jgi:arylsulfatase A-like enzyme
MFRPTDVLVLTAALAAMGVATAGQAAKPGDPQRPNVVVILADDLGWADVGYHEGPIETPSIDRIAREGIQLDRFYTAPMCTPTRAMLLTGRDPIRMGLAFEQVNPWDNAGVPSNEHFMPESFKAAGYQTAMVGKWHLGHTIETFHPNARGFDYYYGHLNTAIDYFAHTRRKGVDWQRNGETIEEVGYVTNLQGQDAARLIRERDPSKPLFLYVAFNAPHNPMQAPGELIEKYGHLPRAPEAPGYLAAIQPVPAQLRERLASARRVYAAMVHSMDQAVGQILDAIDEEGITENTIVLFASDNGGFNIFGGDNTPLRGQKAQSFEGGVRVPAAIRWPPRLRAGGVSSQMLTAMDVFPTLATAIGVDMKNSLPLDGADYWKAIETGRTIPRHKDLFLVSEVPVPGQVFYAAYRGPWKLVEVERPGPLRTLRYLFRLEEDPYETKDLAAAEPEVVEDLAARLAKWRQLEPPDGLRRHPGPHAGWLPPNDWATAMIPAESLQSETVSDFQADIDASRSTGPGVFLFLTPEERERMRAQRQTQ